MVQPRDCSKTMVKRTFVPPFALVQSIRKFCHGYFCHLVNRAAIKQLCMYYDPFLVHFHHGYKNPVTKIQLCFSSVPSVNSVIHTNMVLIHNKTSNREREEKCDPESHKYGISSPLHQNEPGVNMGKLGGAWGSCLLRGCHWEGGGSPQAYFMSAEDLLFPPLPHFWILHISRTMVPLSLLLWPPSQRLCIASGTQGHFGPSWKWTWQRGGWWMTKLSWQMLAIKRDHDVVKQV